MASVRLTAEQAAFALEVYPELSRGTQRDPDALPMDRDRALDLSESEKIVVAALPARKLDL